jgi:glutaredoxin
MVVKSDNTREIFDREKLMKGLRLACIKRPISEEMLEKIVGEIEKELYDYIMEVPSKVIGELVLERLRQIDEVSYVRFASIYRKFDSVETFMKELRNLRKLRRFSCKLPQDASIEIDSLKDIISAANFHKLRLKVFGKSGCEKCAFVRKYLQEKVKYDYYDINDVEGLAEAAFWDAIDIPVVVLEKNGVELSRWSDNRRKNE